MADPSAGVTLPDWAVPVFVGLFAVVLAAARWALKWIASRIHDDIKGLGDKVDGTGRKIDEVKNTVGHMDRRLIVVEERVSPGTGGHRRRRRHETEPPDDIEADAS